VSISVTGPSSEWRAALDLLEACLVEPHFAPAEWGRVQAELLEDIRTRLDRPAEVAEDLTWAALFPDHPWGLPSAGTRTSVGRLSARRVGSWHERHWTRNPSRPLVVAAVGGFDAEELTERLVALLSRLPEGGDWEPPALAPSPPPASHRRRAGHDQAICQLAFRGGALGTRQGAALTLAATLLGAQAGRLFLDLREQRGLAYSVWAHQTSGVQGGLFQAGLATDPGRAEEASRALRETLERFAQTGPTEAEIQGARKILLAQAAVAQQRVAGRASELATGTAHGLPIGEEARRRWWAAISAEDVRQAWSEALQGAHTVLVLPR
jgi:zinc protease